MGRLLKMIVIEDSEDDLELLELVLRKGGFEPAIRQVESSDALATALREESWDLVVSDFSVPRFDALRALHVVKQSGCRVPFFLVSGAISAELRRIASDAGAAECILKDDLKCLVGAIERELTRMRC